MEDLKVRITSHKNHLIIETLKPEEDKNFIPVGGSRIGCVLIETDKYLGMSKEAFDLLKTIKRSGDDIGDVSAWRTTDNRDCIAWLGNVKRLVNMESAEGDNGGIADIAYVTIDNVSPEDAVALIDSEE